MANRLRAPFHSYNKSDTDESDYGDFTAEEVELVQHLVTRASVEPSPQPPSSRTNRAKQSVRGARPAHRSNPTPVAHRSVAPALPSAHSSRHPGGAATATSGGSSLREDIAVAFASHASVESFNEPLSDYNVCQARGSSGFAYRNDPKALSRLVGTRGQSPSSAEDDDGQVTIGHNNDRDERDSFVEPAEVGDVSYPDCEFCVVSCRKASARV
jgi:hypothetical protein